MDKFKTYDDCLGIAARVWCDQDMKHEIMDVSLATEIACVLYKGICEQKAGKNVHSNDNSL